MLLVLILGKVVYCSNSAWMKGGGPILWNAIAVSETFKTSWVMGKHRMNDYTENHSKGQTYFSEAMVEEHPISARD